MNGVWGDDCGSALTPLPRPYHIFISFQVEVESKVSIKPPTIGEAKAEASKSRDVPKAKPAGAAAAAAAGPADGFFGLFKVWLWWPVLDGSHVGIIGDRYAHRPYLPCVVPRPTRMWI